jgi:dopamine beta-monooxygenase
MSRRIRLYELFIQGPCDQSPKELKVCSKVIGAWAMGAEPLTYPIVAGYPIGGEGFNPYVRLEMHYNNPELKSGTFIPTWLRLA